MHTTNHEGNYPMQCAIETCEPHTVQYILDRLELLGIGSEVKDKDGNGFLELAAKRGDAEMISYFERRKISQLNPSAQSDILSLTRGLQSDLASNQSATPMRSASAARSDSAAAAKS